MNYQENLLTSALFFLLGFISIGILFFPVSYYFASEAHHQEPDRMLPLLFMVFSVLLFIMQVLLIFAFVLVLLL